MGVKAGTNFRLPALTPITALGRADLLDLHLVAIATGKAGLSAVCHSALSHCSSIPVYSFYIIRGGKAKWDRNRNAGQSCAVLQLHRVRRVVQTQRHGWWGKS